MVSIFSWTLQWFLPFLNSTDSQFSQSKPQIHPMRSNEGCVDDRRHYTPTSIEDFYVGSVFENCLDGTCSRLSFHVKNNENTVLATVVVLVLPSTTVGVKAQRNRVKVEDPKSTKGRKCKHTNFSQNYSFAFKNTYCCQNGFYHDQYRGFFLHFGQKW